MKALAPSSFLLASSLFAPQVFGTIARRQTVSDKKCSNVMCISATVNGSNVEYVLSATGKRTLGWMGMGFGRRMAGSPMVIMWSNSDGSITLSQRSTSRQQMPTVDSNPSRIATLSSTLSSVSGSTSSFGYTIPADSDTKPVVIYAYGTEGPSSSAVDATIAQHSDYGTFQLNLAGSSTATSSGSSPTSPSDSGSAPSDDIPLLPYQRLIVAHAIFCIVGFLLLLPVGALLARYFRTFTPTWFSGHWLLQLLLAGPVIVTGTALGIQSIEKAGALHLNDKHKNLGVALFVLYFFQCSLGTFIHFVKPKNAKRRPIQNYAHAVIGLLIIALALYQVYLGYRIEWPQTTGREQLPRGVNILFWIWVALLPVLYVLGLSFLPRQFKQERRKPKTPMDEDDEAHDMRYVLNHDRYRD